MAAATTATQLTPNQAGSLLDRVQQRKARELRGSLSGFIKRGAFDVLHDPGTDEERKPPYGDDSLLTWNWHHEVFCTALELVTAGEIKRLGLNAAPGTLKSQIINVFWPAWEWAKDPTVESITASTNSGNSKRDCMACRDLVKSEWYRRYFNFSIRADKDGKTDFGSTRGGEYKATSIGSKDIGSHFDRIRVDDPIGPREALSEKKRKENIAWFNETLSDRLNNPKESAIVVFGHRVHDDDLFDELLNAGQYSWLVLPEEYDPSFDIEQLLDEESGVDVHKLLADKDDEIEPVEVTLYEAEDEDDEPQTIEAYSFQASGELSVGYDHRNEPDELLQPNRRGRDEIENFRRTKGVHAAAAHLDQQPTVKGGEIIEGDWLQNVWSNAPDRDGHRDARFVWVCDPKLGSTNEDSSRAVIQLWWADGVPWSLVDEDQRDKIVASEDRRMATSALMISERFGLWRQTDTLKAFRKLWGSYDEHHDEPFELWSMRDDEWWRWADRIIVENKGDGPSLKDHLQDETTVPISLAKPWAKKEQRVEDCTGFFESGSVYLPSASTLPTIQGFINQAVKYPRSDNDDRIDCAAYGLQYLLGTRVEFQDADDGDDGNNFGWRRRMANS